MEDYLFKNQFCLALMTGNLSKSISSTCILSQSTTHLFIQAEKQKGSWPALLTADRSLSQTGEGGAGVQKKQNKTKNQNLLAHVTEKSRGRTALRWVLIWLPKQSWSCISPFPLCKDEPNNSRLMFYQFKQFQELKDIFPIRFWQESWSQPSLV